MPAIIILAVAAVLIGALRINHDIDEHDQILLDAEYEKQ